MTIRRIIGQLRKQDWGAAFVELLVVVVGIFLGLQANNWNEERKAQTEGYFYLDLLRRQLIEEIRVNEEDIALMTEINRQIKNVASLLFAESWTEEEFQQFKDQHVAVYSTLGELQRPSALKQLLVTGKIDLIRSKQLQEKLFELDVSYENAIQQTGISDHYVIQSVHVISTVIPYGTRENLSAIPVSPEVLLENRDLKSAVRVISIMNGFSLESLGQLQVSRREMRDELDTFLSAHSYPDLERDQPN